MSSSRRLRAGGAELRVYPPAGDRRVVVLVLPGGNENSERPAGRLDPAILRMYPLARHLTGSVTGAVVHLLRHGITGWNGQGTSALRDTDWALDVVRGRHPDLPVVLVGHSMGGRTAARRAAADGVVGAVLLAPWLTPGDPVDHLDGVPLRVIHARTDRMVAEPSTRPWLARADAAGARIDKTVLPWTGHAMLMRYRTWHRLAADGVEHILATDRP